MSWRLSDIHFTDHYLENFLTFLDFNFLSGQDLCEEEHHLVSSEVLANGMADTRISCLLLLSASAASKMSGMSVLEHCI